MKKVAIVGFGFMGRMHYGAWKKVRGAKVVAICTPHPEKLREKVHGNTAGADETTDFAGIDVFTRLDDLLSAGGFDIVDVVVPTYLHLETAVKALRAGFHVLCEKPMALDAAECDEMLAAAEKARGCLMVAQCVRFAPENLYLKSLVESGVYGKVVAADFTRFCAPPEWGAGKSWFLDEAKSGGAMIDTHIHDADLVCGLFGMPSSVTSRRHVRVDGLTDHSTTIYGYGNMVVTADVSWAAAPSFVFESGYKVFFEKAVVIADKKRDKPLVVFPGAAKPFAPRLSKKSCHVAELEYFMRLVDGKTPPGSFSAHDARNAVWLAGAELRSATTLETVSLADAAPQLFSKNLVKRT